MDPLEIVYLTGSDDTEKVPIKQVEVPAGDSKLSCPICLGQLENAVATLCGHIYCRKCLEALLHYSRQCPVCNKNVHDQ